MRKHHFLLITFFIFYHLSTGFSQDNKPVGVTSYTTMGKVLSIERNKVNPYSIQTNCENGKVLISFLKDNIVRIHMAPKDKDFPKDYLHENENGPYAVTRYDWSPGVRYEIKENTNDYEVKAGEIIVKIRTTPFRLQFYNLKGQLLVQEKDDQKSGGLGYADSTVFETMDLPQDEHFFGFGAYRKSVTENNFDKRGKSMTCDPSELGESDRGGGFPTPWFMSTRGYGIYFDNLDDDVTLDMGETSTDRYSFRGTSGDKCGWDMDYYVIYGPGFDRILKSYTEITGKPILPEKWFLGIIQSNCCDANDAFMKMQADSIRNGHYPIDGLVYDFNWRAADKGFEWSTSGRGSFPDHVNTNKYLKSKNFKLEFHENVHFTLSQGMCGCCSFSQMIDVANPVQAKCYWDLHKPVIAEGADWWRQDNSERFIGYSPSNGYDMGSIGGMLYAKILVEGAKREYGIHMPVVSRAGSMGAHRYISPWPGDVDFGIKHLVTDLDFIRDGGLSGYVCLGADLGGFANSARASYDKLENMYRRVIQPFLVYPVARIHGAGLEGWKFPWTYSREVQEMYRYYAKLRYRLHPYIYSAAIEGHMTGRPILASLVFDYQNDVNTYKQDFEYMFGRDILVAPVTKTSETWDVYLPAGEWVHYWTGTDYKSSGQMFPNIKAPMKGKDGLPMFIKKGAIIPMMPDMEWIYEKSPDPVTLDIYPLEKGSSKYVQYDCETPVSNIDSTTYVCTASDRQIAIKISPSQKNYELCVHYDKSSPASVTINGKKLKKCIEKSGYDSGNQGWYFGAGYFYGSADIKTVNIKFDKKTQEAKTIIIRK